MLAYKHYAFHRTRNSPFALKSARDINWWWTTPTTENQSKSLRRRQRSTELNIIHERSQSCSDLKPKTSSLIFFQNHSIEFIDSYSSPLTQNTYLLHTKRGGQNCERRSNSSKWLSHRRRTKTQETPKSRPPNERKFTTDIPRSTLSSDSSSRTLLETFFCYLQNLNQRDPTKTCYSNPNPCSTKKSGKQIHPGNLFVILNRM